MTKFSLSNHYKASACQKHTLVHPALWMKRKMDFVVTRKSSGIAKMVFRQASQLKMFPQSVKGINHAN